MKTRMLTYWQPKWKTRKACLTLINLYTPMYDMFSNQVLTALHRYRDVKFSPPVTLG